MGYGRLESAYKKCILIELVDIGLNVEARKPLKVFYKGQFVGDFVVDVIVNDTVIL